MRLMVESKTYETNQLQRAVDEHRHLHQNSHHLAEHNGSDDYTNANIELYNGEKLNGHQKELDRVVATERNTNIKEKLESLTKELDLVKVISINLSSDLLINHLFLGHRSNH